jgi:DegV family protein with EDD domain
METKIITESLACLGSKLAKDYDIYTFGEYVIKDGKSYREEDINADEYYRELRATQRPQKTAHVGYQEMKNAFVATLEKSTQIVYLAASTKLTGTYDVACVVAREYPDCDIQVYNTQAILGMEGLMCLEAAKLGRVGTKPTEIVQFLEKERNYFGVLGALETTKFIEVSGRAEKAKMFLASVLSIKPVVTLRDGEMVALAKARTMAQAKEKILSLLKERAHSSERSHVHVILNYIDERGRLDVLVDELKVMLSSCDIEITQAPPTLGTHLGPGAWCVSYYFYQ